MNYEQGFIYDYEEGVCLLTSGDWFIGHFNKGTETQGCIGNQSLFYEGCH